MAKPQGFVVKPRDSDFILGSNSPLSLSAVNPSGDWTSHIHFYEAQMLANGDSNDCVLFAASESLDAQMDLLIEQGKIPANVLQWLTDNNYMDTAVDGKLHFHSSPRYLGVLTGNGTNGNSCPEAWDVLRSYGAIPWKDLPVTSTLTIQEYFKPIPQNLLDKGKQFLSMIGGKGSINYHWINNGGKTNVQYMKTALPTAPLCIGVAVTDAWNQAIPSLPAQDAAPQHSVMTYLLDAYTEIYDHYLPDKKKLLPSYPIHYVLQGIVTPVFPAPDTNPLPTPLPPNPTNQQISSWLDNVKAFLTMILISLQKGRNIQGNKMRNFSDLLSLDWNDAKKAVVMAVLTPVVGYVYQIVSSGSLVFDWGKLGSLAVAGFFGYLVKNFFSTPDGAVLGVIAKPKQ